MTTLLAVVSENSIEKIGDEGKLDAFFKENPAAQDPLLLFSLGSDIREKLLFSLYEKYPDSSKQSRVSPLGFRSHDGKKATLDLTPSMQMLDCDCQQCTLGGENCGLELIVDIEIPTLVASRGGWAGFAEQILQNFGTSRSQTLRMPELSNPGQRPAEIKLEDGRLTFEIEGSPPVSFSRKIVKLQILLKKAGFHTFGMGIIAHEALKKAPAMYIAAELWEICKTWDLLLEYFKEFLSVANREILNKNATIDKHLIRKLANTADVCEELLAVHQQQYDSWRSLIRENEDWLRSPVNLERGSSFAVLSNMRDALKMLGRSGKEISDDLVVKNDKLIERTHNLISIDEAYKAREQNASIKRLSWVTSLFGMNVDLLENNPAWTTYFYLAVPMFVLIMFAVLLLKRKRLFLSVWRSLFPAFRSQVTDLEMQLRGQLRQSAAPSASGSMDAFFWAAEHGSQGLLELQISKGIEIEDISSKGRTALQLAAGNGHMSIVERLLNEGAEVNTPASALAGRTALQAAAEGGYLHILERLLNEGADVNAPLAPYKGRTALQAAAEGGHMPIVERLLEEGANVNAPISYEEGRTALQAAAGSGHLLIVERLLDEGADVNEPALYDGGRTPLQAAAEGGHLPVVGRLLQGGAKVNAPASYEGGRTALQAAAGSGHFLIAERLLKEGAQVNALASDKRGRTALQAAAEGGHLPIVERLLREGAEVNAAVSSEEGKTALRAAAGGGHILIVGRLLNSGAEVNEPVSSRQGRTALQAAAEGGHMPIVERLLGEGAEVNASASAFAGRTALQAAAENGHLLIVEYLLNEGADVNAPPASYEGGRTALQAAAGSGHLPVVEHLLSEGAQVNAPASFDRGRTALQAAAESGHLLIVECLLKGGAEVNALASRGHGRTALQAAAEGGNLLIVECLLKEGAEVNAPGSRYSGVTALAAAAKHGHMAVVERLRLAGAKH